MLLLYSEYFHLSCIVYVNYMLVYLDFNKSFLGMSQEMALGQSVLFSLKLLLSYLGILVKYETPI
jgi:hypothetical protein